MKDIDIILNISKHMCHYQKTHNIKGECLANVSYLLNNIKLNFPSFKAKARAVLVAFYDKETDCLRSINHVVIDLGNGDLLDPSHEINSIPDTDYCLNFNVFYKSYGQCVHIDKKILNSRFKELIELCIRFEKHADDINNGEWIVADKDTFNKQADYIDFINMVGGF